MQAKTPIHLLLIALSYIILIVLVNPLGDFPINDDWAYARSVLSLVEDGEFHLLDWGAMTLVSQVVWGALWVKLFGFSFDVLRFSTIFLGFVALTACYYLLLSLSKETWIAVTGTFVLMVNPLFIVLANSFMTDIPFLALSVWSAFFLLRAIERDSIPDLMLGMCFAIAALLLRQIALALPLAFLFAYAARFSQTMSIKRIAVCVTPLAVSSMTYIGYIKWLKINDNLPHAMIWSQDRLNTNFIGLFDSEYADLVFYISSAGGMLLYLGLFSIPMMLALYTRRGDRNFPGMNKTPFWIITGILLSIITFTLLANSIAMPVRGNLFTPYGIGPFTLRDVHVLKLPHLDEIPQGILQFITALSVLGALLLVHGLGMKLRGLFPNRSRGLREIAVAHWHEIFLWILILAYISPLVLTDYFDRYLLFLLPFAFALLGVRKNIIHKKNPAWPNLISLLLIPVFGLLSVALAHDYMSWNRTRLHATNWVKNERQLDHYSIDSGFEFNGFYGYDPRYDSDQVRWVRDDKYVIAFGDVPGYESEIHFAVERLLPIGPREIIVLRRSD